MKGSSSRKTTKYIADKIIELKNSVGWSQSELARKAGITSAAISQIEKGDRMPSLMVIMKLARVFNVSMSELVEDSSIPSPNDEAQIFFRKFGDIKNLSTEDQQIIQALIIRLGN